MDEECENCRFWEYIEADDPLVESGDIGWCRRYPPVFIGYTDTGAVGIPLPTGNASDFFALPVINRSEWCGEYKPEIKPKP